MSTVSTLCATSTLGAAALGYAFGHHALSTDPITPASQPQHVHDDTALQARHSRRFSLLTPSSKTPLRSSIPRSSGSDTTYSYSTTYSTSDRRDTVGASILENPLQRLRLDEGSPLARFNPGYSPDQADSTQTEQPARLHRLSTVRLSSAYRPSTSESRLSRSSSTAFTLGSPLSSKPDRENPSGRNKLVKRSLSVQYFTDTSPKSHGLDISATLARPATRHQRTEVLRNSSLLSSDSSGIDKKRWSHPTSFHSDATFEHFGPEFSDGQRAMPLLGRGAQQLDFGSSICQIVPASPNPPTLVVVKSLDPSGRRLICSAGEQLYTTIFKKASANTSKFSPGPLSSSETQKIRKGIDPRPSTSLGNFPSSDWYQIESEAKRRRRRLSHGLLSRSNTKKGDIALSDSMREPKHIKRDYTSDLQGPLLPSSIDPRILADDKISNHDDNVTETPRSTHGPPNPSLPTATMSLELPTLQPTNSPSSDASGSSMKLKRAVRPSRASITPSERTSDSGTRVFDDDGEFQSDTHFDSIRTALTSSSAGRQGIRLETLFDKQDDLQPSGGQKYLLSTPGGNRPSNISEESESVVTPVRTDRANGHGSPHSNKRLYSPNLDGSSDGRLSPKPLSLGRLAWDIDGDEDPETWSAGEENTVATPRALKSAERSTTKSPKTPIRKPKFVSPDTSPSLGPEQDKRSNLFDWAEQQLPGRNPNDNTPPRPKTVHGKKDTENRGVRGNGRRVQAGLHVRSQSVPALQDLAGSRPNIMNKFGTWGIGSKGVTEDWDDDFDFLDTEAAGASGPLSDSAIIEDTETPSVFVPKIIQAQQRNVLANISLLREWGLLIEELKELRMKVVGRGARGDHVVELFDEVDAMVELADQEAEDDVLPNQSSKASTPALDRERRDFSASADTDSVQGDHLAWDEDNADEDLEARLTTARSSVSPSSKASPFSGNRPRKDSEAVARSVIQAIQKKRAPPDGLPDIRQHSTPVKKVPFDTATLKHIVPYVSGLVRRAKQVLRDADGLSSAPVTPDQIREPALAQAFVTPGDSPTARPERRLRHSIGQSTYESHFNGM